MAEINGHADTIPLGLYLWRRIKQVGTSTIMGVPGDFNLELLDYVYEVPDMELLCNANELNAAYAADGYARIKGSPGVLVTTHGVGELSALNGIVGSLSERISVIHVVGQTPRPLQEKKLMIHHSVGHAPDHQMYNKMTKLGRIGEAELWDEKTAPAEIDRAIRECIIHAGPVCIFMPLDLCWQHVPASLLDTPIDLSIPADDAALDEAVDAILTRLCEAESPVVLVDGLVSRYNARQECRALAETLKIPTYSSNMGKAIVDETAPYFAGMYQGAISEPHAAEAFEASDCVLLLGNINADTNTGGFSRKIKSEACIEVNVDNVVINQKKYEKTHIKHILARLQPRVAQQAKTITRRAIPEPRTYPKPFDYEKEILTQSYIWDRIAQFTRPDDVVLAETGTAAFGLVYSKMPENIRFVTQTYYGSIGYATPAALGTDIALRALHKEKGQARGRTVLVTGDGSLTLTMQEIGSMIYFGLKPIIIVINNGGYTIERVIHGARQKYNTSIPINFAAMLHTYRHPAPWTAYFRATTKRELEAILVRDDVFANPVHLTLVELVLEPLDCPWRLVKQISIRSPEYHRQLVKEGWMTEEGEYGDAGPLDKAMPVESNGTGSG